MATVLSDIFTFTKADVVPGAVYNYKIIATNAVGDSQFSQVRAVKAAGVPDAPSKPVPLV